MIGAIIILPTSIALHRADLLATQSPRYACVMYFVRSAQPTAEKGRSNSAGQRLRTRQILFLLEDVKKG
ncbi:hypothetical protein BofuT4_uP052490.1 [Botrytis cinerea T4]|uniref:Uncharacterized protein n=1 Tax=Botryotinia fuckeliana (strain T4) TaxID=999810 RepID=G2XWN0_BOTF4|nr:hypothetical protein BofuT4_uP052490.1 [Botrytis cinerea T4]